MTIVGRSEGGAAMARAIPSGDVVMLLSLMVSSSSLVIRQDSRGRAGADTTEG